MLKIVIINVKEPHHGVACLCTECCFSELSLKKSYKQCWYSTKQISSDHDIHKKKYPHGIKQQSLTHSLMLKVSIYMLFTYFTDVTDIVDDKLSLKSPNDTNLTADGTMLPCVPK